MTLPVLIVLCISCNTMADGADATRDAPAEDRTTKTVASCLEKIMAVPWPTRGSKVEEVWEDFTGQIELAFWQGFIDDDGIEEKLGWWIEQFGKKGPETDLRLLLSCPEVFLNPFPPRRPDNDPHAGDSTHTREEAVKQDWSRKLSVMREIVQERMLRKFLADRHAFKRFYEAKVWVGDGLDDDSSYMLLRYLWLLEMKFRPPEEDLAQYRGWALIFMLVAHATGRDDVLDGAKAEDLHPRFKRWWEWFLGNVFEVSAHPEEPVWVFKVKDSLAGLQPEAVKIIQDLLREQWLCRQRLHEMPDLLTNSRLSCPFSDWPRELLLPRDPEEAVFARSSKGLHFLWRELYYRRYGEYPPE